MDKEKLFAELCASAPPMPDNWAPPGKTRLPKPADFGVRATRALYEQRTGKSPDDMDGTPFERGAALYQWYRGLLTGQSAEYSPMWRVHYANSVLAAMEGV